MRSAAQDFQKAVLEGEEELNSLLRRTRVIAAKLNLKRLEQWVDLELEGFPKNAELPIYRKVLSNRLEIYNSHRELWQFAGHLNYAFEAREPIAKIEMFSRQDHIEFPVTENFSIKNDFGDAFGSDWPQRLVVLGSEYQRIINALVERWTHEFEMAGIEIVDAGRFAEFWKRLHALLSDDSD